MSEKAVSPLGGGGEKCLCAAMSCARRRAMATRVESSLNALRPAAARSWLWRLNISCSIAVREAGACGGAVGGTGVGVGGTGVGGMGVGGAGVGGSGVALGGSGVAVGGRGVGDAAGASASAALGKSSRRAAGGAASAGVGVGATASCCAS